MRAQVEGAPRREGSCLCLSRLMPGGVQFYSAVELVEKDGSVSSLLTAFNDQSASDRIVQFLRLLTSAFIRNRADFFRHFIDEEMDIKDFCTHVGPQGPKLWGLSAQPWALLPPLPLGHVSTGIPSQGTWVSLSNILLELPELCGFGQVTFHFWASDFPSEK